MTSAQHSRPLLPALLAAAALVHQACDQYVHCQFGWDKVDQLAGAVRLCAGQGLTIGELNPADLARPRWRPLAGWPPGYSYLAAGFLAAGLDVWQAALAIDWLAALVYLASWYVLAAYSGLGRRASLWFWTYWAIAYCPLVRLTSSDQLAAAIFSLALVLGMSSVPAGAADPPARRKGVLCAAFAGLTAGLAGAVRFAYWPLAAVVPLGLLVWGQPQRWLKAGLCALSSGAVLLLLVWHQRETTGHATYLTSVYAGPAEAWQWQALRQIDPFPAGALGLDLFWHRAHDWLRLAGSGRWGSWCLAAAVLAAFSLAALRATQGAHRSASRAAYFYGTGVATLLCTLAMLCWLSLRYPPISGWTHVQELRYYAPVFGFLTVAWFGAPYHLPASGKQGTALGLQQPELLRPWQWFARAAGDREISRWRRGAALGLAALLLATMAGGTVWRARRWWRVAAGTTPRPEHSVVFDAQGIFVHAQVTRLRDTWGTVYYVDERLDRRAMARLAGAIVPLPHELPRWPRATRAVVMLIPDDLHGQAARALLARWPVARVQHVAGLELGLWQYEIPSQAPARGPSEQELQ
ncbi:MAG: hypothetical protein K6T86_00060 [Pirellulales bacterium]|nr:hypothetical protein [Pirellulales bacterium]